MNTKKSEYNKRYNKKHREQLREYHRNYWKSNPQYRKKVAQLNRARGQEVKQEVFTHYFGENYGCAKCGISDYRVLQLNHINGGGNKHRKSVVGSEYNGGGKFYRWIKKNDFPKMEVEPLCANCHQILRYETPHTLRNK